VNVLLCPLSSPGYLYPAIAVGRRLHADGHAVSVLCEQSFVELVASAGLTAISAEALGGRHAFEPGRWFQLPAKQFRATLRACRAVSPDVLLTSVLCHGPLLAAEGLDLPIVVLGFAAHLWTYAAGGEPPEITSRAWRERELLRQYRTARELAGLPTRPAHPSALAGSGLFLRGDPVLEFPGALLPDGVRHAGPCAWEPPADPGELAAIDERLTRIGKPAIYVHLGRTFGGACLWPRLNELFTNGPYQAIVELGRSGPPNASPSADITAVRKPWMTPLIDRSNLVLTNATSSPVLAALRLGKPLIVAPNGSEQPLLADACLRAGVALRLPNPCAHHDILTAATTGPHIRERLSHLSSRLTTAAGDKIVAEFALNLA
jgi:UDP:flavonoid glycosyltransferase YjiC (YdhE family)